MTTFGEKKMKVVLITLTMLRYKYVKWRSLSLDVENDEYIVRCTFGGCLMMCSKVIEGSLRCSPVFKEARKGKRHDNIRAKLLFIPSDDRLIFLIQGTFVEFFSFKSCNIATAYLCKDHVLTTTKCDCCLLLLRTPGKN